jgi:hypothetical protein
VKSIYFANLVPISLVFAISGDIALNNAYSIATLEGRAAYSDRSFSSILSATNGLNFISSNPTVYNGG